MALFNSSGGILSSTGQPMANNETTMTVHQMKVLEKFRHTSVLPMITSSDIMNVLKRCGDTTTVIRAGIPRVFDYAINQALKSEQLTATRQKFTLDYATYTNVKVDEVAHAMMCDATTLLADYQNNSGLSLQLDADARLLCYLPAEAASCNRGQAAGQQTASYNMGAPGAPVLLNRSNILSKLGIPNAVLDEQRIPEMDRWSVYPAWVRHKVREALLAKTTYVQGTSTQVYMNGYCGPMYDIGCMKGYSTPGMLPVIDPVDGLPAWYIVSGWKKAVESVFAYSTSKVADDFPTSLGKYWMELITFGFGVPYPEALTVMYVRPDPADNI